MKDDQLISECKRLEKRLTETLEGANREEIELLRGRLRDAYELVLLKDPKLALGEKVMESLWQNCYYTFIQREKKSKDESAENVLRKYLDEGSGFFHFLIRHLKDTFNSNSITLDAPEIERQTCHDALGYLGDLARYREGSLQEVSDWGLPRKYYHQSRLLSPIEGKPRSQLGLLATLEKNDLEAVFCYCLSLSARKPFAIARKNLSLFYQSQRADTAPQDATACLVKSVIDLHAVHYGPKAGSDSLDSHYLSVLTALTSYLAAQEKDPKALFKILIILIFTAHDLATESSKAPQSHLVVFALTFDIMQILFSSLLTRPEDKTFLPSIKVWCDWLVSNPKILHMQEQWDPIFRSSPTLGSMHSEKSRFWKTAADFLNSLNLPKKSKFSETTPLEEDFEIIGFQPLLPTQKVLVLAQGPVYSGVPVATWLSPATSETFRISVQERCIDRFGKAAVAEKLIHYHETAGCYSLQDSLTEDHEKARERRERGMRMMAQARLQETVVSLENDLSNLRGVRTEDGRQPESAHILILDTSSFLYHIDSISVILAAEKNLLVVPRNVIANLDELKKGNEKVNVAARDAIRFLQEKLESNNHWLRAQKDDEFIEGDPSIEIPGVKRQEVKQMINCPLYFLEKYGKERTTVLGDDEFSKFLFSQFGIPFANVREFASVYRSRSSPRKAHRGGKTQSHQGRQ